jgi:REP element-mobilizing transposase RayT
LSAVCSAESSVPVGQGLAPAEIHLSQIGIIAEQQLLRLEERFPDISIDKYVIMPNHIHILLSINRLAAGASPCPTLSDVICAFKSLTTRICREGEIFQASFYDHIVRDNNDYLAVWQYIDNNPHKWELDKYYQS